MESRRGPHRLNILLLAAAVVPAAFAQRVPGAFSPGPQTQAQPNGPKPAPLGYGLPHVVPRELGALSQEERTPRPRYGAKQIGVRRAVPHDLLAVPATLPDGRRVLRLALHSEGAIALRVHFRDFSVGSGQVWVYDPQHASVAGPYTGKGLFGDGEFWSSSILSDDVVIEFDAPAGLSQAEFPFRVDAISHQWDTILPSATLQDATSPAPCEIDVSCYPDWAKYASGVVMYNFTADSGGEYVCSGAFVNTAAGTIGPYMLTAHHCISSSREALNMEFFVSYQTSSCNGKPPDFPYYDYGTIYVLGVPIPEGDYTLLRLPDAIAPPGAYFFPWSNKVPSVGEAVVGIHHPEGSWARISFGSRTADKTFNISGSTAPADLYYQVSYDQGVVEPGSSGSPLLNSKGEIIGTLTGIEVPAGPQFICDNRPVHATYSRFSKAFQALEPYLNASPAPAFTLSPQSLTFTQLNGVMVGDYDQFVEVRTKSPTFVPVTASVPDGWLEMRSSLPLLVNADTPAYVVVRANIPRYTQAGSYHSSATITVGTNAPLTVPITIAVNYTQSQVVAVINSDLSTLPGLTQISTDPEPTSAFAITLTETAGVGTTLTTFKIGTNDISAQIPALFGNATILPWGMVTAVIEAKSVPGFGVDEVEIGGVDAASGITWNQKMSVYVYPGTLIASGIPALVHPDPADQDCPFRQHVTLSAAGSVPADIASLHYFGQVYQPPQIASLFGSSHVAPGVSVQHDICWPPGTYPHAWANATGIEEGTDPSGHLIFASLGALLYFPPPMLSPLTVKRPALNFTSVGPSSRTASVDPGSSDLSWSATVIYAQSPHSWLSVTPSAGMGAGAFQISSNPAELIPGGLYRANIIVTSLNSTPQYQSIPVTLQVPSNGVSVLNGASFTAGIAPGMVVSLFDPGVNLASGIQAAWTVPLSTSMQGTSVTVNNIPAPLYYVSPQQVNMQIPYEVAPGPATLTVSSSAGLNLTQQIYINAVAPGIFLANDGRHLAPNVPAKAGGHVTLYLTGQGPVSPAVATGAAPPSPGQVPVSGLPKPYADVKVYVNGVKAQTLFVGIPYYLVGVTQVNFIVPPGTAAGTQPVVVVVADTPSNTAYLDVVR